MKYSMRRRRSSKTNLPIWQFLLVNPTLEQLSVLKTGLVNASINGLDFFFIAVSQKVPNAPDYQLQAVPATRYHKVGIFVNLGS
jgi:hypothetical protein